MTKKILRIGVSVPAVAGFTFEFDKTVWDAISDTDKQERLTALIRSAAGNVSGDEMMEFAGISVDDPSGYEIDEIDECDEYDAYEDEHSMVASTLDYLNKK